MTYIASKPDSGFSPVLDCPTIQGNFDAFNSIFSSSSGGVNYNHTAMNLKNQGDHEVVLFQQQSTDPNPTDNIVAFYSKAASSAVSTQPQLFSQTEVFLPAITNNAIQMTYNTINNTGPIYQSFLPGNPGLFCGPYLVYFGNFVGSGNTVITVSPASTRLLFAYANVYAVTIVGAPVAYPVATQILTPSTFQINLGTLPANTTIGWLAIGTV